MTIQDREQIAMKGSVVWVQPIGTTVEIWISSPTGDSSDSFIHHVPCVNETQAKAVAHMWKAVWGIK